MPLVKSGSRSDGTLRLLLPRFLCRFPANLAAIVLFVLATGVATLAYCQALPAAERFRVPYRARRDRPDGTVRPGRPQCVPRQQKTSKPTRSGTAEVASRAVGSMAWPVCHKRGERCRRVICATFGYSLSAVPPCHEKSNDSSTFGGIAPKPVFISHADHSMASFGVATPS